MRHHRSVAPYRAEKHGHVWMVCDANGINWGLGGGAVFLPEDEAKALAEAWNDS